MRVRGSTLAVAVCYEKQGLHELALETCAQALVEPGSRGGVKLKPVDPELERRLVSSLV